MLNDAANRHPQAEGLSSIPRRNFWIGKKSRTFWFSKKKRRRLDSHWRGVMIIGTICGMAPRIYFAQVATPGNIICNIICQSCGLVPQVPEREVRALTVEMLDPPLRGIGGTPWVDGGTPWSLQEFLVRTAIHLNHYHGSTAQLCSGPSNVFF